MRNFTERQNSPMLFTNMQRGYAFGKLFGLGKAYHVAQMARHFCNRIAGRSGMPHKEQVGNVFVHAGL